MRLHYWRVLTLLVFNLHIGQESIDYETVVQKQIFTFSKYKSFRYPLFNYCCYRSCGMA